MTAIKSNAHSFLNAKPRIDLLTDIRFLTAAAIDEATDAPAAPSDTTPYEPKPYHDDPDELVTCPSCKKGNDSDASFCDQCGFDLTSTGFVPAPYLQEDDENVICPSCQMANDDDASYCDQCGFKLAGATGVTIADDSTDDSSDDDTTDDSTSPLAPDASAAHAAAPDDGTAAPSTPVASPIDANGNADPAFQCMTDGCNHLASAHQNLTEGDNLGACQMNGCDCGGLTYEDASTPSDPEGDDSDGEGGVALPTAANAALATPDAPVGFFTPATPAAPAQPVAPQLAPPGSNPAPVVEPPIMTGTPFTAVIIIEGQESDDGRGLLVDSLAFDQGLPLMGLATSTHDPSGFDPNDPAVWCGRIDDIVRVPGENGTQLIKGYGHFFDNEDGAYFADLVGQMGRAGISADVGVESSIDTITDLDSDGWPITQSVISQGRVLAATIVPMPAFSDCYVTLGDDRVAATPVQSDSQPEPIMATGARNPHHNLIPATECLPCASGKSLSASAAPVRPPRAWFDDPSFTVGDGMLKEIFTGRGARRLGGAYACPLTITAEGRVYGHIAPWNVCHTGYENTCTVAPKSRTNYAHFKRSGQTVFCDDGSEVTVGTLTFANGHADMNASASMAMAHYDNVTSAWAHVNIGEDEFGIWVAGAVLPDVDEVTLRRIKGSHPSGDWRTLGGNLELVGVHSVNQPGFPISMVADGRASLVAAGAYLMQELADVIDEDVVVSTVDVGLRRALAPFLMKSKDESRRQMMELRRAIARRNYARIRARRK